MWCKVKSSFLAFDGKFCNFLMLNDENIFSWACLCFPLILVSIKSCDDAVYAYFSELGSAIFIWCWHTWTIYHCLLQIVKIYFLLCCSVVWSFLSMNKVYSILNNIWCLWLMRCMSDMNDKFDYLDKQGCACQIWKKKYYQLSRACRFN